MISEFELKRVEDILSLQKNMLFAYLYGSEARGKSTVLSDIDIAVFVSGIILPKYYPDIRIRITGELESIFKNRELSVVILNETGTVLSYEIVRYGKIIYQQSKKERVEFEMKVIREFFDTVEQRKENDKYLYKYIKERTYGYRCRKYKCAFG